jgi:hypothetical protein
VSKKGGIDRQESGVKVSAANLIGFYEKSRTTEQRGDEMFTTTTRNNNNNPVSQTPSYSLSDHNPSSPTPNPHPYYTPETHNADGTKGKWHAKGFIVALSSSLTMPKSKIILTIPSYRCRDMYIGEPRSLLQRKYPSVWQTRSNNPISRSQL